MEIISITDLTGNTEPLTGMKSLRRKRKVNGEKAISFTVIPTNENQYSFPMVQEESKIDFDGETYVIKQVKERSVGKIFIKQCEAIHSFFVDLINSHEYSTHNGSMTFMSALDFIFSKTKYTFAIVDSFYAKDWENFGDDNRLSLFQKVLERYESEFIVSGNRVTLRKKIGNDTDFQFRYNYNIKTLERTVDSKGLNTYIKGFGKGIEAEYTSPNASVLGIIHAKPVRDERYTTYDGLMERMKKELQDTPLVSITVDFVDMRRAGFPYDVPNEGDRVPLIYEPMGIDIDTRIMEVEEEFDDNLQVINSNVTLSNYKKDFAGTLFDTVNKAMGNIVGDDGKIKYNVLDDAVKLATEAIKSAQTELKFENGILAINPDNPNEIVAFNSAGIGISRDGGQTFQEALTYQGLVASVGVIGFLSANNIRGGEMMAANGKFRINLDESAIEFYTFDNQRKISSISQARGADGAEITYFTVEKNENGKAAISIGVRNQDGSVGNNIYVDGQSGNVAINGPDFEVHSHTKNYGDVDFGQKLNFVGASFINTKLPGGSWEIENIGGHLGGPIFAPRESGKGSLGNATWVWGEIWAGGWNNVGFDDFIKRTEYQARVESVDRALGAHEKTIDRYTEEVNKRLENAFSRIEALEKRP